MMGRTKKLVIIGIASFVVGVAAEFATGAYLFPLWFPWHVWLRQVVLRAVGPGRVAAYWTVFSMNATDYFLAVIVGTAAAFLMPRRARLVAICAAFGIVLETILWAVFLWGPRSLVGRPIGLMILWRFAVVPCAVLPAWLFRFDRSNSRLQRTALRAAAEPPSR